MAIFPREEAERRINAINDALRKGYKPPHLTVSGRNERGALRMASEALGLDRRTLPGSLPAIKKLYGIEPDWSLYEAPKTGPATVAEKQAERRKDDRIAELEKETRDLLRELNAAEDLKKAIFGLVSGPFSPPKWTLKPKKAGAGPGIPILFTSDFQWGEVVSANEMDGINEFNREIASIRYKRLIGKTIDLCFAHMVNPDYPGIIYLRGGDAISGDIHQELRETNDLQSIPAVRDLVEHEAWGIRQLADRFGKVLVVSVPGNHGRTTIKPHSKRYAETNYDTLSAWWLQSYFKHDKRVTFWTPESGDALIPVYGYRILLTHGDRIGSRGGQGFIGPAATITRGMKKLSDYYATLGTPVDAILVGHFHTPLELEYGFSNGSLPGYSEYARDFRMRPACPSQWLFFVHPDYGITCRWPIFLEPKPKHPSLGWDAAEKLGRKVA